MNAIDLLTKQHRDVERLFELIDEASWPRRRDLLRDLSVTLAAHARIEEQLFYPKTREPEAQRDAAEDHRAANRAIEELIEADLDDDRFEAELELARDRIEQHVDEEEGTLFPAARRMLDDAELLEMGEEMEALYAELTEREPRPQPEHPAP
jgi:hemerythrin superfamily protein